MASGLRWEKKSDGPPPEFLLSGRIDEHADFAGLIAQLTGPTRLDLSGIQRINSTGVREWEFFIRAVENVPLEFALCSSPIVEQLNATTKFLGAGKVVSVHAPYLCPQCDAGAIRTIELGADVASQLAAPLRCPECRSAMEFDDLPDHYFRFLNAI